MKSDCAGKTWQRRRKALSARLVAS